jgi:uncharacterized protein YhaN
MIAWGPFTDWSVDLSKGAAGLHLIYGPNEAGKSAALRGLKALLFGIDERTTDDFLHGYRKLLIAGTLRRSDGETIEIVRKKGRTKTLLAPDDTVVEERTLQGFLGGVTPDTFSRMFGLNHDELEFGGKEIVSGKGDVGQSLFVAALGGRSVQQILGPLEEEAGRLFAPKASAKRAVNIWYDQYQQAMKEAKEASLPGRDWEEHTRRRNEAEGRKTALSEEIRGAKSELGRLERIQGALISLGRRKELQKQRADMGDVLILPAGFPERRRATLKALSGAREVQAKAQNKLQELESQIEALIVPTALLDEADAVTELHQLMGSHVKAMQDLPKRIGEAEQLETDAAAILDDIHPGATAEEADSFKVGLAKRKSVRELGGRHEALLQALRSAKKLVETLQAKIDQARNNLAKTDAPRDPSALKDLLKRVRRFGDLEADLEKKRGQLSAEIQQANIEMQRLPLWSGTLDQLETMAVPDDETVTRFEKRLAEIEQQSRNLESKLKDMVSRESELAGNIKTLELTSAVPTEEDLAEARLRREAGWKLVRTVWLEGGAPQAEVEAFGGAEPLDQAYEKSVHHADEVADRLRREAERVAQHASLVSERDRTGREIRQLTEESNELSKARLDLHGEWQGLWRAGGIDPLPPLEMRSWMQKQRALVQRAERIRAFRQEIDCAETQIAKLSGEIVAELKRMGEKEPEPILNLNALIDHSQNVVDRIDRGNADRQKLETTIADAEKELAEAGPKAEETEESLQAWQFQWTEAVREIGLSSSASPEVASQLLDRVQDLAKKTEELAKVRKRIEAIQRDSEAFARHAHELANRVAPDLLSLPPEGIASQLNARLSRGRQDEAARKQLLLQYQEQERDLAEAEDAIGKAEHELNEMCALAKCGTVEQLENIERLSVEATAIDTELKSTSKELLAFAGGGTVEDLVLDAQTIDPDALPGQISELREQLSAKESELSQVDQTVGSEKNELARMDGSPRAADAAERAQSSLAQIRDGIERYARLRLACIVLHREMEQYRAKNQGPVLKRASEIFAALTLRSFAGLRTNFDENDRPVLIGVRPSEEQVGVDGMSDGTCDQLYLSLRLASLEKHLEAQEPMPFIIDDILVNFDDRRAEATLKVLAEFSKKTQIIFFTHHQHLVGIAEKSVSSDVLHVHPMYV